MPGMPPLLAPSGGELAPRSTSSCAGGGGGGRCDDDEDGVEDEASEAVRGEVNSGEGCTLLLCKGLLIHYRVTSQNGKNLPVTEIWFVLLFSLGTTG